MKRLACVAGILFLAGSPALACPSPLTGKDAAGTTQSFGVTLDASTFCYGNIAIVDGANAANKATVTAGNALKVDGSAVTQPVSGTVTARAVGNAGGVFDFAGQNAAQPANSILIGGEFNTTPTTLISPAASPLQLDSSGNLLVNIKANSFGTLTVTGTVTANQGTSPWVENVSQFGGSAVVTGTGTSGAGIPRVTVSSDSNVLATQSGPWSFTCISGCSGGGGGGTTELVNSAGQQLGAALPGQNNIPLQTNQAQTLPAVPPFPLPATQLWDGQHYLSLVAPNGLATQAQTAIVVRNPDAGNIADPTYGGSGSATENSVLKGLYQAVTSSIPTGSNTIGAVTQASGPWTVNCVSGCTGGGSSPTTELVNSAGQQLGAVLPGLNNIPLSTNQAPTLPAQPAFPFPAIQLWDGQHYGSITAPNIAAGPAQGGVVVALSPNTPLPIGSNVVGAVTQSGGPWSVSGTVTANQGGTWTVQQGTPPWSVTGNVASAVADSGNPVKTGGVFNTTQPTVTNAQRVDSQSTARGALIVATGVDSFTVGGTVAATESGTWTVQPGNTANTTPWLVSISQGGNTAAVNASSQLSVVCANCSGSGVSQQDLTGFTFGTTVMVPVGGVYSTTPSPIPSGQAGAARLTANRAIQENLNDSAGRELGSSLPGANNVAVQVNQATNLTQYNKTVFPTSADASGSLRTASVIYDGQHYADVIAGNAVPGPQNGALVVTPSPKLSLQCPFTVGINQTASTQVATGQTGKFLHICGFGFVSASAQNVSLVEGTGSTCGTGTGALAGGTTASIAAAANGGLWNMTDRITIPMQKAGDNLCVLQSAAGNVSGTLTYGVF